MVRMQAKAPNIWHTSLHIKELCEKSTSTSIVNCSSSGKSAGMWARESLFHDAAIFLTEAAVTSVRHIVRCVDTTLRLRQQKPIDKEQCKSGSNGKHYLRARRRRAPKPTSALAGRTVHCSLRLQLAGHTGAAGVWRGFAQR